MPAPFIVYGAIAIAGLATAGYAAKSAEGMFAEASKLTRYAVIGGGLYVSYRALKAGGVLK